MKLKNKKTGEIKDWDFGNWYQTILNPENKEKCECNLNDFINRTVKFREEWEDMSEEPKGIQCVYYVNHFDAAKIDGVIVGFETKEEAKLAVRKLKAWKRLKDKGFGFINFPYKKICKYDARTGVGNLEYQVKYYEELESDLDLLFSQEDD